MIKPVLYRFQDKKLISAGQAKIEFQTPDEYLRSTPLIVLEEADWGLSHIRFLRMPGELDEPACCYVLVERFEDGKPNPHWALIHVYEVDIEEFKTEFKKYCEKK